MFRSSTLSLLIVSICRSISLNSEAGAGAPVLTVSFNKSLEVKVVEDAELADNPVLTLDAFCVELTLPFGAGTGAPDPSGGAFSFSGFGCHGAGTEFLQKWPI